MSEQQKKSYTWAELKDFCNGLNDEQLNEELVVDMCETSSCVIASTTSTNIYIGEDSDDYYDEESMIEAESEDEVKREDYRLQPKGTPFLTTEY